SCVRRPTRTTGSGSTASRTRRATPGTSPRRPRRRDGAAAVGGGRRVQAPSMPSTTPLPARNGPYGFGRVARVLHWSIAVVIAVQLLVGYLMEGDEGGHGRGCGRSGDSGHGRGRGGGYDPFGDDGLLTL